MHTENQTTNTATEATSTAADDLLTSIILGKISHEDASRQVIEQYNPTPAAEQAPVADPKGPYPRWAEASRKAEVEKQSIRERMKAIMAEANKLKTDMDTISAAIRQAEDKIAAIGTGNRRGPTAKGFAVAESLITGRPVDPALLEEKSDNLAYVSVGELNEGLYVLRQRLSEAERALIMVRGQSRSLAVDYYRQHAIVAGADYMAAAHTIRTRLVELLACQNAARGIDPLCLLIPDDINSLRIVSMERADGLVALRRNVFAQYPDIEAAPMIASQDVSTFSGRITAELEGK